MACKMGYPWIAPFFDNQALNPLRYSWHAELTLTVVVLIPLLLYNIYFLH